MCKQLCMCPSGHFPIFPSATCCSLDREGLPGNSLFQCHFISISAWKCLSWYSDAVATFSGLFFFFFKNLSLFSPPPPFRIFLEFVHVEVQRLLNNLPLWGCPRSTIFYFVLVHLCWNLLSNLTVKVPTSLCSHFSVKGRLPSALSFHFLKIISEGICSLWGWQCPRTVPLSESIAPVGTAQR